MVTSLPGIRLTIPPQAVRKKNRHTFSFILNTSKVIFICKNISVQLILHSNACVSYLECLDRYLPTRYTNRDCPPKKYGHHHDLIDQYSVFFPTDDWISWNHLNSPFTRFWWLTNFSLRVQLVEQELLSFPQYLSSHVDLGQVHVFF